jgi:hypothetical protein
MKIEVVCRVNEMSGEIAPTVCDSTPGSVDQPDEHRPVECLPSGPGGAQALARTA